LVVRDSKDGIEGLGYLKTKAAGRCGFIDQFGVRNAEFRIPSVEFGVRLLDKVKIKSGYEDVAKFLLWNTYLVDSLEKALYLITAELKDSAFRIPHSALRFVTPDGDLYYPVGIMVGGSNEVSGHGILQRKREMKVLGEEVAILTGRIQETEEGLKEAAEGVRVAESELEMVKKGLHDSELEALHLEKDGERQSDEIMRLNQRIEVMKVEEERLLADKRDFERELQVESGKVVEYLSMKEEKENGIRELQEGLLVHKGEMERVNNEVTDLKITATSQKGRFETLKATLEKVTARQKELLEMASLREMEIAEGSAELEELEAEIYEVRKGLRSLLEEKEIMEGRLTKAREAWQAENEKLKTLEDGRQRVMRELEALRKEVNSVELAVSKLRMDMSNIAARVSESFNTVVEEAVELYRGESINEGALNGRREELGSLVNDLGEVNLTAIEEYQGLEERHNFLTDQQADLNKSLDSLQTAIQRINSISRERFQETFDAVNANFKVIFQRLFKGGKAEMALTDSEDLLEAGIDIIAQPPGKKLQGVSLMSGGEKALTAVSLIFSIFLLKPTPFCLLDEVDAPLDDANVGRFNEMVMEMSGSSQFILITHNKTGKRQWQRNK
ncbi:MAG: chromosome segregation protein SMC, partial [Deltaproteobacteria bacterium]|nr:chromosome segregation protein SMC [Deltaproteobacteria bacterium]